MERLAETIAACATELKAVGMTSSAAAYRATVFTGLAKLAELLPPSSCTPTWSASSLISMTC